MFFSVNQRKNEWSFAFNNADQPRELRIALGDTPAQRGGSHWILFGDAKAELFKGGTANHDAAAIDLDFFSKLSPKVFCSKREGGRSILQGIGHGESDGVAMLS